MNKEKLREFIKGLTKLTRETGVAISGCGCCGSPFLEELSEKQLHEGALYLEKEHDVVWVSEENSYLLKQYLEELSKKEQGNE